MKPLNTELIQSTALRDIGRRANAYFEPDLFAQWLDAFRDENGSRILDIDADVMTQYQTLYGEMVQAYYENPTLSVGEIESVQNFLNLAFYSFNYGRYVATASNDYLGACILDAGSNIRVGATAFQATPSFYTLNTVIRGINQEIERLKLTGEKFQNLKSILDRGTAAIKSNNAPPAKSLSGFIEGMYWLKCTKRADEELANKYGAKTLLNKTMAEKVRHLTRIGQKTHRDINQAMKDQGMAPAMTIPTPYKKDVEELKHRVRARAIYTLGPPIILKASVTADGRLEPRFEIADIMSIIEDEDEG